MRFRLTVFGAAFLVLSAAAAFALGERGTVLRETRIYISPDATSARVGDALRGHEMIVLERTNGWVHVEALLTDPRRNEEDDEQEEGKTVSGWIPAKGFVGATTQDGDRIIFGEAADSEDQASQRQGRRGAAQDAMRLYYRVYDLFPASPIAGEALYRFADIRWQIERADVMSRPSAKERDPMLRTGMNEDFMKLVIKKFSGSKWADLAAFHLIENRLCGDWEGAAKCPVKEAEIYEKYAAEHPQSPDTAEALYQAAWRWSALIEIYKSDGDSRKSDESRTRATSLAQKTASQFPQSDWGARAQRLLFMLQQGIPAYGNAED